MDKAELTVIKTDAQCEPIPGGLYPDLTLKEFRALSLPSEDVISITEEMDKAVLHMLQYVNSSLDVTQRLRMNGIGIRRYGFTDKTSDVAEQNMRFSPPTFNIAHLKQLIRHIELLRNLSSLLRQLLRITDDELLVAGDEAYAMALLFYNTLKVQARQRVPGADDVFRMLQPFFIHRGRTDKEPTEHEVERDVRALLHGHKDGKIVIENEHPHLEGGKHTVIDETHKPNNN